MKEKSLSEHIRVFVSREYPEPAKRRGESTVRIVSTEL